MYAKWLDFSCITKKNGGSTFSNAYKKVFLMVCTLDAVGSWQIILPMPNLERTY